MVRLPILPISAAVASVALAATPGLAAAKPLEGRDHGVAVSFPLLALPAKGGGPAPAAHYSHSSHESHSSHYSGSHNSHASHSSHTSHFSSSPVSPSPTPAPTQITASPQPSSPTATTSAPVRASSKPGLRSHKSASPSGVPRSPIATFSPRPAGNDNGDGPGGDVAIGVVVIAGVTVYIIHRRRRRPR